MGVIFRDWQQTATAAGTPTPIPSDQVVGRRYSLRNFGAIPSDTFEDAVDCTAAIELALAFGLPLTGDGKWYGVHGNIERSTGFSLWDAKFKQLDSAFNGARRTLHITGGFGYDLRRITVHRNGAPTHNTSGIWISGADDVLLEECEVTGDGLGYGIVVIAGDRCRVRHCYVHDMQWSLATDPANEVLTGLRVEGLTNSSAEFNRIGNLTSIVPWVAGETINQSFGKQWRYHGENNYRATNTGTTGSSAPIHTSGIVSDGAILWEYMGPVATVTRAYEADGMHVGACTNFTGIGNEFWNVWQGVDCNGGASSGPNRNVQFIGHTYTDIDLIGEKWVYVNIGCSSTGSTATRCGRYGLGIGGAENGTPSVENMTVSDFKAINTGSNGNWSNPRGFHVSATVKNARHITFIGCQAIDDATATCTISIASPAVITKANQGKLADAKVHFKTTGALPTGLALNTAYYVKTVLDENTFTVAATVGGSAVNTSGTQSGVHSVTMPTMVYGFLYSSPAEADAAQLIGCYVEGDAVPAGNEFSGIKASSAEFQASGASGNRGGMDFFGATSGAVSVRAQAAAGTYNLNLPTTAGSPGQFLTSAGGSSAAMTWSAPAAYNHCFNGAFDIWQEATSYALGNGVPAYTADGFRNYRSASGSTISRQTGFSGARYCLRLQRNVSNSSNEIIILSSQIPSARCYGLAGKTLLISADIRTGANYSGGQFSVYGVSGTGIDETLNIGSITFPTGSASSALGGPTLTAGLAAARYTFSAYTVPSGKSEVAIWMAWQPSGTAGADDYVEITNIKIEIAASSSSASTAFEQEDPAIALTRARRRYRKSFLYGTAPAQNVGVGTGEEKAFSGIAGAVPGFFGVRWDDEMAATPTITLYNPAASNAQVRNITDGADCSSTASANVTTRGFDVTFTGTAGTAVGEQLGVHYVADARL